MKGVYKTRKDGRLALSAIWLSFKLPSISVYFWNRNDCSPPRVYKTLNSFPSKNENPALAGLLSGYSISPRTEGSRVRSRPRACASVAGSAPSGCAWEATPRCVSLASVSLPPSALSEKATEKTSRHPACLGTVTQSGAPDRDREVRPSSAGRARPGARGGERPRSDPHTAPSSHRDRPACYQLLSKCLGELAELTIFSPKGSACYVLFSSQLISCLPD